MSTIRTAELLSFARKMADSAGYTVAFDTLADVQTACVSTHIVAQSLQNALGVSLPNMIDPVETASDQANNIQAVVDYLETRILQTDLSHISGQRVVAGSLPDTCNLVELVGTLCSLNDAELLQSTEAPPGVADAAAVQPRPAEPGSPAVSEGQTESLASDTETAFRAEVAAGGASARPAESGARRRDPAATAVAAEPPSAAASAEVTGTRDGFYSLSLEGDAQDAQPYGRASLRVVQQVELAGAEHAGARSAESGRAAREPKPRRAAGSPRAVLRSSPDLEGDVRSSTPASLGSSRASAEDVHAPTQPDERPPQDEPLSAGHFATRIGTRRRIGRLTAIEDAFEALQRRLHPIGGIREGGGAPPAARWQRSPASRPQVGRLDRALADKLQHVLKLKAGSPRSSKRKKQREAAAREQELERLAARRALTVRMHQAALRRGHGVSLRRSQASERLREHDNKVEASRSSRFLDELERQAESMRQQRIILEQKKFREVFLEAVETEKEMLLDTRRALPRWAGPEAKATATDDPQLRELRLQESKTARLVGRMSTMVQSLERQLRDVDVQDKLAKQERQREAQGLRTKWLDHLADQENRHLTSARPDHKKQYRLAELRRMLNA